MGMYTKGELRVLTQSAEAAHRFADELKNLESIEDNIREINIGGYDVPEVYMEFDSGRYANAEYVLEEVRKMAKEKFTAEDIEEITGDIMTPECILFMESSDFDSLGVSK